MSDYRSYLEAAGMSKDIITAILPDIQNRDDLKFYLDAYSPPENEIVPERMALGAPNIERSWKVNLWKRFKREQDMGLPVGVAPDWVKVVERRRHTALIVTLIITTIMSYGSYNMLKAQSLSWGWMLAYLGIYSVMTYFLVSTFIKMLMGTWHAIRGSKSNPWHPSHTACEPGNESRVAIIYPVYHEDIARVGAGMASVWESLVRDVPLHTHHYDLFLLSDSRKPEYWIAEKAVVFQLRKLYPDARIFYRWRTSNDNAKLGNVSDFCRRYGRLYKYMFVMDADSLVKGSVIHQTLRMMEGNHRLGILQTNPTPIMRTSLFGRMQQFAGCLYGSVFTYAMQAMYMGHASYIGHNAMIRLEPFMQYCMLPDLPGSAPWGGKPLSHDIIEAAMMARAGYEVWFLPELKGSYEEIPANILGFLVRERRWMQGNLQHLRFLWIDGIHSLHREGFVNGLMGYLSAPLWAVFLVISAYSLISFLKNGSIEVNEISKIEVPAMMMFLASMVFLFLPRIFALIVNIASGRAENYGGKGKMVLSMLAETVFSLFFSLIIMIYMTRFIWLWAKRKAISWGTQQRDDEPLPWSEVFRTFGWVSAVGVVASGIMYKSILTIPSQQMALLSSASGHDITPFSIMFWFMPILGGFAFSMWIVRITSKSFPWMKKLNFFMIPEEVNVPPEITTMNKVMAYLKASTPNPEEVNESLLFAVKDKLFYVKNRKYVKSRPWVAKRLLAKINNDQTLTLKEYKAALKEKACFERLHELYAE